MATLSTTAWVLHDLGLAAGFGGSLFGKFALDPAVRQISSREERGRVLKDAWGNYRLIQGVSLGAAAVSWFLGRRMLSGRAFGKGVRRLVLAKDILFGVAVANGVASMISGSRLAARSSSDYVPIDTVGEPPGEIAVGSPRLRRASSILGSTNVLLAAGVIGITTLLAMKTGRSKRFSLIERFLP